MAGIFPVISVSIKPGDGVSGAAALGEDRAEGRYHAHDGGFRVGVVCLANIAGNSGGGCQGYETELVANPVGGKQCIVNAELGGNVDVNDGVPAVLAHVDVVLIARNSGIVHEDVDLEVTLCQFLNDSFTGVVGRDVHLQRNRADLVREVGEGAPRGGYIEDDDLRTVPVEGACNRLLRCRGRHR